MTAPSRELLRRFYGRMLGRQIPDEELYAGVPFETYYQLMRIKYPRISRRTAAQNSQLPEYKQLAPQLEDDAAPAPAPPLRRRSVSGKDVDLGAHAIDADVERLDVDKVRRVTEWAALRRLASLRVLATMLCKTPAVETIEPPLSLDELEVVNCDLNTLKTLLSGTRCRRVRVEHSGDPVLDVSPLGDHAALDELRAGAAAVRGLHVLAGRSLRVLKLARVAVNDTLLDVLASSAAALRELSLLPLEPLSPDMLPAWSSLERFEVTVHEPDEDAWLDYAASHPSIAFTLRRYAAVEPSGYHVEVAGYAGEYEILRVTKGKKSYFELSGDLAADFGFDDNGALEEAVRPAAKAAKRRIQWSSEHDTFVATAKKIDDLHWLASVLTDLARDDDEAT